jgi:hypothetical protein
MKTYQLPAGLESYRSLKDGTLKLSFETGELSPEQMANVHYSLNKVGYLAFSPDALATHELDEIDKLKVEYSDNGKTPSQRLKAVLYLMWKQKPEGFTSSEVHYLHHMEKLIEHFKLKLDA